MVRPAGAGRHCRHTPKKALRQKKLWNPALRAIFWNEENLARSAPSARTCSTTAGAAAACNLPGRCMNFGDLDDSSSKVSRLLSEKKAETWRPELKAKPNVYYIGLPKPHLSGRVLFGDKDEWAPDVAVTLIGAAGSKRETRTDGFGEFAFDALDEKNYTVRFDASGYPSRSSNVTLDQDVTHLGEVVLRA
jgi:hypothetical protein